MEFKVIKTIIDNILEKFLIEYRSTFNLFENENVKNKLIHPGEYGTYKENLCKELFKTVLPGKYGIGTGFVYNNNKDITTQCDIIIYDYNNTPCISLDSKNRFFPQEAALAIGEIKSKLTKQALSESLIKLAKAKSIRKDFKGISSEGKLIDVKLLRDANNHLFTFLICDEILSYNAKDIGNYIQDQYDQANIPIQNQHNIIVSLKNGIIIYKTNASMEKVLNITDNLSVPFSYYNNKGVIEKLEYNIFNKDEVNTLKHFTIQLNNFLKNSNSYYPEPGTYLL